MLYYGTKLSDNITETPEGFLICHDVIIARTGTQEYSASEVPVKAKDGAMVQIHRTKDEVLDAKTIASFEGKPVTVGHPEHDVTSDNWSDFSVGTTTNVRAVDDGNNGYIMADLMITSKNAIIQVRDGLREVSCGYDADYVDNGDGTGAQKGILGNHVALVRHGRCGALCSIKDSKSNKKEVKMTIKEKFIDALSSVFDSVEGEATEPKKEAEPKETTEKVETQPDIMSEISSKLDMMLELLSKPLEMEKKEEKEMTADTIARAEIIFPGITKDGDVKTKSMDAFMATEEGKEIVASLSGVTGDALFVAVSELLKVKRNSTMTRPTSDSFESKTLSIGEINQNNAQFWANKK